MPERKVKVWGLSADEIAYEALHMTWEESLCSDPTCKCANSARWRMARAIEAVREFERANASAEIEALKKRVEELRLGAGD